MHPGLNLQQAPPISVPFRFFIAAPLFGAAAGLTLLAFGPGVLVSRWAPTTLASTHLVTIGFIGLVMCGALMQMLPVIAGVVIPRPILVSRMVHLLLVVGTLSLAAGFHWWSAPLLKLSAALLSAGFVVFVAAVSAALLRARGGDSVTAMRAAVAALAVTVALGVFTALELVSARSGPNVASLTNLHLAWGILGWVGLLVCGVAYQVVPMFQITPRYPRWLTRHLAPGVLAGLVVWTALYIAGDDVPALAAPAWLATWIAVFITFAVTTLRLQARRRRRTEDVTRAFWIVGMLSIPASGVLWTAMQVGADSALVNRLPVLLGVCLLIGFAVSVVNGMLYKIVPFLVWFHLKRSAQGAACPDVPNVKRVISAGRIRWQFRLHLGALGALILAALWPAWPSYLAGLALVASFSLLWANLAEGALVYVRVTRDRRKRQPVSLASAAAGADSPRGIETPPR